MTFKQNFLKIVAKKKKKNAMFYKIRLFIYLQAGIPGIKNGQNNLKYGMKFYDNKSLYHT